MKQLSLFDSDSENTGYRDWELENEAIAWNPAHFGETPRQIDPDGQLQIFWDTSSEPPDPDDFPTNRDYQQAWQAWEKVNPTPVVEPKCGVVNTYQKKGKFYYRFEYRERRRVVTVHIRGGCVGTPAADVKAAEIREAIAAGRTRSEILALLE